MADRSLIPRVRGLMAFDDGWAELARLTATSVREIEQDWRLWARRGQAPPRGNWRVWLFLGGRGAGKTRAGAEWVSAQVREGRARRIALVGPTLWDVRAVMIEGPSGLARIVRDGERPIYQPSRRRLVWPNGAEAFAFSAEDPDSLRGPQFDAAWCDEIGAWERGEMVWDTLMFALRLGEAPRVAATTTPRPTPLIRRIAALAARQADGVIVTHARMAENADNLAPHFVDAIADAYGGSGMGRQEIDGELVGDLEGGMFSRAAIELNRLRRDDPEVQAPFDRVVVAVDPPASSTAGSDECGIVAAAIRGDVVYVLADASMRGLRPMEWAARAVELAASVGAGLIVAEANQGGDMVQEMLEMASSKADEGVRVRMRHATRSKQSRAEPVSGYYDRGEVRHVGAFPELEDQLCAFGCPGGCPGGRSGAGSPDRVDALVWAIGELRRKRLPPAVIDLGMIG